MNIEELTLKEWLILCWRAELACTRSFRELAERIEDADPEFSRRLRELSEEEEDHARTVDRFDDRVPWPLVWRLDESEIHRTLKAYFPILFHGTTQETVTRDAAMTFVRSVEEESSRFYTVLAEHAPDERAGKFFRTAAELESSHLKTFSDA